MARGKGAEKKNGNGANLGFEESAKLEKAIRGNLRRVGYGW